MSWTRRLMVAGLIVAAQASVVVVLAQSWQTSNAAHPPCSVSCTRDTAPDVPCEKECLPQSCTGSVCVSPSPLVPPNPAPTTPAMDLEPTTSPVVTELRATQPTLTESVEVRNEPVTIPEPPANQPEQMPVPANYPQAPVAFPTPAASANSAVAVADPEVRPVPPPARAADPDTGAVMPAPIAPLPPPPSFADETPRTEVASPPAPVPPEMKPVTPVPEYTPPPPPPVQDPLPPLPSEPPMQQIVTPPEPQVVPAPVKQTVTCPWTLRIENIDGRAHLEARNGKEVQFRVVCAELDVQAPRGYIQAVGDVIVSGHELYGTCKKLTINWHDEHVLLDGGVDLKCRKDGEEIEVKGEKLSFRLSVISTVRADTMSDAPVRRAVIE